MQQETTKTAQACSTLFWTLSERGLGSGEVNQLVKDIFNILRDGGTFTVGYVNYELSLLGWYDDLVDEDVIELILTILENEFKYSVTTHTIH